MPGPWKPKKIDNRYTIKSLKLDLESAKAGKTWMLLPPGYRDRSCGMTYPLPGRHDELQRLVAITIPPYHSKQDCGCYYLRRALKEWRKRQLRIRSAVLDVEHRRSQIKQAHENFNTDMKKRRAKTLEEVRRVKEQADEAIASLNDLFQLGREGIDQQMRAYLRNEEFNGETITGAAFRQCFNSVVRAVKGLGVPSDQRPVADETIMEEVAASLKSTQQILSMATDESVSDDSETTH